MKKKGITLIEILVIIAVILILIAILWPAIRTAREAATGSDNKPKTNHVGGILTDIEPLGYDGWAMFEFEDGRIVVLNPVIYIRSDGPYTFQKNKHLSIRHDDRGYVRDVTIIKD